jgi:hypothetical protein
VNGNKKEGFIKLLKMDLSYLPSISMNSLVLQPKFRTMKKIILGFVSLVSLLSFTSCKISKDYVQYISKKEEIVSPEIKKVIVIGTDNIAVNEFKKTFKKNDQDSNGFRINYLEAFLEKINAKKLYENVSINASSLSYDSLDKEYADYVIHFSNFEITNRVEWNTSGGSSINGMGGLQNNSTSVEYCIVKVKVEVYDAKTNKEVLDFVSIGEASVFLFNFTKTFQKAKERSIIHILNFLESGKTTYEKY